MLAKLLLQTALWVAFIGANLFIPAGTLRWPAAWWYLAELAVGSLALGLWLMRADPALLAERMKPPVQTEQRARDKVFVLVIALAFVGWTALMALDAVRFDASDVPFWLQLVGALGPVASFWMTAFSFAANSRAAAVVKLEGAGHPIADGGPYRYVRHPMYSGALLFFIGLPLLLGSWWGLATMPLLVLALAVRTLLEERTLAELPGYAGYAERVRHRLVPGVW